jgi:Fur family transcriptional regulator, peroxide stress response regulator
MIKSASEENKIFTAELDSTRKLFREHGLKLTQQRLEILRAVRESGDHPSAEEVYRRVRPVLPTVSLDTVYRALMMFERIGAISRVEILDDRSRFEPKTDPHHHLVCVVCRGIEDFPCPEADRIKPPAAGKWGKVLRNHLELRGVCRSCLARQGGA